MPPDQFGRWNMQTGKAVAGAAIGAGRETGTEKAGANTGLAGAALSALGASACCLGPLALVSAGASGAWIGNLSALAPYRWIFIVAALGFIGLAAHRIFRARSAAACESGTACGLPRAGRGQKIAFWLIATLVLAAIAYPYFLPLFY